MVQGTFCNQHTYECFLTDVQAACCDENGRNCPDGQDIPNTCPVGCAVLFPEFVETCRAHVQEQAGLQEADYEEFETLCLDQDGLALVEYALELRSQGCAIDLGESSSLEGGLFTPACQAENAQAQWGHRVQAMSPMPPRV